VRRALFVVVVVFVLGCHADEPPPPDPNVHTTAITFDEPKLPDAPGKIEVDDACRTCHSARYLLGQPKLSRKAWTAEVDKMKTAYGAPVADAAQPVIVDYLVHVNGVE
jgi:hypothetical protein